jgi:hypothetical protein
MRIQCFSSDEEMEMMQQKDSGPWTKEPWPWLLMMGPAIVIVAGIFTAILAVRSDDGLVVDDYYKQGLAINKTIHRSEAARNAGISASLVASSVNGTVTIHAAFKGSRPFPDSITISLLHPTRAGYDQKVVLRRIADGAYVGKAEGLEEAQWNVAIEQPDWRLVGSWDLKRTHSLDLGLPGGK